jgi:5'-3' exonuclease
MGVKGLNQFLKRLLDHEHLSLIPVCNFAGKKIAIDAILYVCAFKTRNNFIGSIIDFLVMMRENRIHPFFVFDGTAPLEKQTERLVRSAKRAAQKERILLLERDFEIYKETNQLSGLLSSLDLTTRRLTGHLSHHTIQQYIDKLKSCIISLTEEDVLIMKELLHIFGIPFTVADGEGEFLCAALNRHGMVDAVMTADTDVLPCLAPTVINKLLFDKDGPLFQVVDLKRLLYQLKLDEYQFIDLCIMCGTDFNSNIPRVGPITSYDLILRHRSIDNITNYDTSILNHVRVRQLFAFTEEEPTIDVPFCGPIDFAKLSLYTNVEYIKNRLRKAEK